nr:hypothetical protein [Tanacetum cinerariifolium]
MSSCGWLATVRDDYVAQLINPFSCETINLLKVDTFLKFVEASKWYFGIGKLLLLHNNKSSCSLALPLVVVFWGCSVKLDVYNKYAGNNHFTQAYILGLDDDERKRLLVVIRKTEESLCGKIYRTWCFQIFEYDLETRKWSEVKDLGNKTLFVGYNSSFWMEDTTSVIKGNCVYFTDEVLEWYIETNNGRGRDMGIYHLADGTIESHFTGESRSHFTPPIWLQSM